MPNGPSLKAISRDEPPSTSLTPEQAAKRTEWELERAADTAQRKLDDEKKKKNERVYGCSYHPKDHTG